MRKGCAYHPHDWLLMKWSKQSRLIILHAYRKTAEPRLGTGKKKSWSNSGRCISSLLPCESWMHRHSLNLNRKWEPIVYFINKLAHCGWFYDNRCPGTRSRFRGKSIGFRGIRRFAIYFKNWKRFRVFFSHVFDK